MAAIKGFTEAQNASLANAEVGNLILIHQITEQSANEDDSSSDDDNEDDDGSNEGDDDDEHSDSDDEESGSESESESGAVTPRAVGSQDDHAENVDTEHAEHIEDVSRVDLASAFVTGYRALRNVDGGNKGDQSDTKHHPVTVYLLIKVAKNAKGAINDLSLVPLRYSAQADTSPGTFQIYGKQCVPSFYTGGTAGQASQSEEEFISIHDLPGGETLRFTVSPQGDLVRSVVFDDECPACDEGWLDCITQLAGMVKDYTIITTKINEPAVCPSCIGIDLMKEHQTLRAELENFNHVSDFGAIHAFHGRLATRRRELDYEFYQFDERKWGYLFDDMLSDDDQDAVDNSRFQDWDEANDPSNGATLHPASPATIASIPVKKYAEVKREDDAPCVVCRNNFEDEKLIMQLPCEHFFCANGCITDWLKEYDTCPVCRAKVPAVKEGSGYDGAHGEVDAIATYANAEQEQIDADADQVVATDRDDDVTMVDAW